MPSRSRQTHKPKLGKEYFCPPHGGKPKHSAEKENSTGIQHGLRKHRGLVVFVSSEFLESPPIQNFDNEKRKVNYKNIWLGYVVNRKDSASNSPTFLSQSVVCNCPQNSIFKRLLLLLILLENNL